MITFNLAETLLFNVGINTFSIIITIIVIIAYKSYFTDTHDVLLARRLEVLISLSLLTDTIMWILNGKSGYVIRIFSYVNLIIYFLLQIAITFEWLRYAYYRIFDRNILRKKGVYLIFSPLLILIFIVLTSPINGWCFYLDDSNYFHRGIISDPMSVVLLIYLSSVSVMALIQYRKESLIDRKKELKTIAFFVVPPFLGGAIQIVFYGVSFIWPCAVISSLLILINKGGQAISRDSLTGLNNRRNMERYLATYENGDNNAITLIMLDINHFKHINDYYGHSFGDLALKQIANILRETFNKTSSFLGRYGGDEFVIIIPQGDENFAREVIDKIKSNIDDFNSTKQFPFQLSISAGYAISVYKTDNKMKLFKEADENMYQDKILYHDHGEATIR